MTNVNPTYLAPAQLTLSKLLESFRHDLMKNLNAVKIGIIQSFNPILQEAVVAIAFQRVTSIAPDGTETIANFPLLLNVPVYFPGGGGFTLTFPVSKGDECIILFNDCQIDNWIINGQIIPPTVGRVHDLSDGIALVGVRNNTRALANVSITTTQLRSDDGATYVEVAGGGITNIIAPTAINLTAPTVNITASTQVNVSGGKAVFHGITEASFDAGGTGFVYKVAEIDTYTNGISGSSNAPSPPQVPL